MKAVVDKLSENSSLESSSDHIETPPDRRQTNRRTSMSANSVARTRKFSKMAIVHSSRSARTVWTVACKIPEAGPTPSGRIFGLKRPQCVEKEIRSQLKSSIGIWWKEFVISKSTNSFQPAALARDCGDYRPTIPYICIPQEPIPNVQQSLAKAAGLNVFVNLDMTNSFHQIPIDDFSCNLFSVSTQWGLFRPKFLPEGVGPASGILQAIVRTVSADFEEWTIIVFDNFLILATDFADALSMLERMSTTSSSPQNEEILDWRCCGGCDVCRTVLLRYNRPLDFLCERVLYGSNIALYRWRLEFKVTDARLQSSHWWDYWSFNREASDGYHP